MSVSRRAFLVRATAFSAGFAGLGRVLRAGTLDAGLRDPAPGYGPLVPDPGNILDLPAGFSYRIFSRTGQEMDDGLLVPGMHDGMAAFPGPDGKTILVRNHELESPWPHLSAFGPNLERLSKLDRSKFYDYGQGKTPCLGGTTTVLYDTKTGRVEKQFLSLAGTTRNCAGGPTPWGTWISCEEFTAKPSAEAEKAHGFAFEVPATLDPMTPVTPTPLAAMGRFYREAIAVDPASGCVYQSEDLGDGLMYRFIPTEPGRLAAGGRLQALMIRGHKSLDTRNWDRDRIFIGERFPVEWVELDDPLSPKDDLRYRGFAKGAARFARAEGMWYGRDAVYWCCTNGGKKQKGQIWRYVPSPAEATPGETQQPGTLELFVEPNDGNVLENCDNITVAPWGDLIVCEDEVFPGAGRDFLVGVTPQGKLYKLGRNAMNDSELAGAAFSPDGTTLFVNIQTPGLTLAITGPWNR